MEKESSRLVFVPAPASGHLTPMIELAKLLVNRYPLLSITVITMTTPSSSPNADEAHLVFLSTSTPSSITFLHVPLIPPHNNNTTPSSSSPPPVFQYIEENSSTIGKVVSTALSDSPRPIGLVVDMICTQFLDIADSMGLPTYLFFICSAAFLTVFLKLIPLLLQHQHQLEFVVPGFDLPLPRSALPRSFTEKNSQTLIAMEKHVERIGRMKAIMVNTFYELEKGVVSSFIRDDVPPVYAVGPLVNINTEIGEERVSEWLEGQPDASVVFLCFGSEGGRLDVEEIKEIAEGIELSGFRFIWSLRRPGGGDPMQALEEEGFLERTKGRGVVMGWAKQTAVLGHRAVGGFVSHCGWNSILESLWFGVPVAAWPLYAEQEMNSFQMVEELGLATFISEKKSGLRRRKGEEIAVGIRGLMNNVEVREKVKRIQIEAKKAVMVDGLSFSKLGEFMQRAFSTPFST